jgi:ATP-binding cassette subfamily C (CFTR/MRP) protein 1
MVVDADLLDPLLLELSLRENLDPEGLHSDSELWDALEKSHVGQTLRCCSGKTDDIAQGSRRHFARQARRANVG